MFARLEKPVSIKASGTFAAAAAEAAAKAAAAVDGCTGHDDIIYTVGHLDEI